MTLDPTSLRISEDGRTVSFRCCERRPDWADEREPRRWWIVNTIVSVPLPDAIALHAALGKLLQVAASEQKPQSDIDARAEQAKEAETKI